MSVSEQVLALLTELEDTKSNIDLLEKSDAVVRELIVFDPTLSSDEEELDSETDEAVPTRYVALPATAGATIRNYALSLLIAERERLQNALLDLGYPQKLL